MSKKFSIIVSVDDSGKIAGKVFNNTDTQKAIDEFTKLREGGKECYLFVRPVPTKANKSAVEKDKTDKAVS